MIRLKTEYYGSKLNEFYFGGNSLLKGCDQAFESLRKKYKQQGAGLVVSKTEEFRYIKNALCKVFGFSDILLNISTVDSPAAIFTMPAYLNFSRFDRARKNELTTTNEYGVCFTKDADMVPYINANISAMELFDFTGEEMTAVVIHEVGHNFFATDSKTSMLPVISTVREALSSWTKFVETGNIKDMLATLLAHQIPGSAAYKTFLNMIKSMRNVLSDAIFDTLLKFAQFMATVTNEVSVIQQTAFLAANLAKAPVEWTKTMTAMSFNLLTFGWIDTMFVSYRNEKFSDNFATTYGYGPALVSAMNKLGSTTTASIGLAKLEKIDPVGGVGFVYTYIALPKMLLMTGLYDCHPNVTTRILDQIKMLKKELRKQDLKPETKAKILKDIEEMEKRQKEYFDTSNKNSLYLKLKSKLRSASSIYGGDARELLSSNEDDKYDYSEIATALSNRYKSNNPIPKGL